MARDFENMHDIEQLDDRELRDLVREQLGTHGALDLDQITVMASDGHVTLSGRVGTDGERRIAEHVLTDVLGIMDFSNDLVVDSLARAESPQAIDDHLADEEVRSGTLLGDMAGPGDSEAHHTTSRDEDLEGTADYQSVMEDGVTWNPPSSPTPEGFGGTDDVADSRGEAH